MTREIFCCIGVILCAIVTQYFVGWAGAMLHQIGENGQDYALFVFTDDRHQPMTTNILMNVFIPNIISVFLYIILDKVEMPYTRAYIWLYVVTYFAYRYVLICCILRRKELYTFPYEWGMAGAAFIICGLLSFFFFGKNKELFITADELKEELWFAIILIVYTFVKHMLDNKIKQDDVLTRSQLEKYIKNKFVKLYARYKTEIDISCKNKIIWIIIFAIMIFEDFNRGELVRKIERIKLKIVGQATVGIMQMSSHKDLTDEESIKKAYEYLVKEVEKQGIDDLNYIDTLFLNTILRGYNPDENYAKSVTYIYEYLYSFISCDEYYSEQFHMWDTDFSDPIIEKKKIWCDNISEWAQSMDDGTEIFWRKSVWNIFDGLEENRHIRVNKIDNGWGVTIYNISDVVFDGKNGQIFSVFPQCAVLCLSNCRDVEIRNFCLFHKESMEKTEEMEDIAILLQDCRNITLTNMKIIGSVQSWGSEGVIIENSEIKDCIQNKGAIVYSQEWIVVRNVEIHDCYTEGAIIDTCDSGLSCSNVWIYQNKYQKNPEALAEVEGIRWENNEQLPWI